MPTSLTISAAALLISSNGTIVAGSAMTAVPAAKSSSPEFAPAAATVDDFHAALVRGDTRAAVELLATDVLIFEEGGAERSRDEYARHHLAADAAFAAAATQLRTARSGRVDGDIAWILTEGRTTGRFQGKPIDRVSTETMVLKRADGMWRIAHIHWSSRVPPSNTK